MRKVEEFKVLESPLVGSNLIEASAGTGKTFSIAVLVLRILLKKNQDGSKQIPIRINQILLVTFTEAAVAELELRVRKFVSEAYNYYFYNKVPTEKIIIDVIDSVRPQFEKTDDFDEMGDRLEDAFVMLDETPIYTIHGFCNMVLTQFSFETGEVFDKRLLTDQEPIIEQAINEFWRIHISNLDKVLLKDFIDAGFNYCTLKTAIEKQLERKELVGNKKRFDQETYLTSTNKFKNSIDLIDQQLMAFYQDDIPKIWEEILNNNYAKRLFEPLKNDSEKFIKAFLSKYDDNKKAFPGYFQKIFTDDQLELAIKKLEAEESLRLEVVSYMNQLFTDAHKFCKTKINELKEQLGVMAFDDLILRLHNALYQQDSKLLVRNLRRKFKAFFIDEFQDTDKLQYEIFYKLFEEPESSNDSIRTIIHYIGDPKQCIYTWRMADLQVYSEAKQKVDKIYSMTTNYRSTDSYNRSMNTFFKCLVTQNYFENPSIEYIDINGYGNKKEGLKIKHESQANVSVSLLEKKDEATQSIVEDTLNILNHGTIAGRSVKPNDIGILVRTGKDGKLIKELLSKKGVPTVIIDDSKIMKSDEATMVRNILYAIEEPSLPSVNRAILNDFTGVEIENLNKIDVEKIIQEFHELRLMYEENGPYQVFTKFLSLFNIKDRLLSNPKYLGERKLTNYYQLIEIIHNQYLYRNYTIAEMTAWLKRESETKNGKNNEYEQRLESDEEAVNIVTIHKSKGLDYNIVMLPHVNYHHVFDSKNELIEFRDELSPSKYAFSFDKTDDQKQLYLQSTLEENRRLIYVALTRAVYATRINFSNYQPKNGSFNSIFLQLKSNPHNYIESGIDVNAIVESKGELYANIQKENKYFLPKVKHVYHFNNPWHLYSFSSLSGEHHSIVPKNIELEKVNEYDDFIYNKLKRGVGIGNFIHELFEDINFCDGENNNRIIARKIKVYEGLIEKDSESLLHQLVENTLKAKLTCVDAQEFTLSTIKNSQRIVEMPFYFNLNQEQGKQIQEVFDEDIVISQEQIVGYMNGFIDLVFEREGKYYILDWKTNYLGNHVDAYNSESLQEAMTVNNYHLQYLIYTLCLVKYLRLKLPDFDYKKHIGGVYYVFIRGTRESQSTGVFQKYIDEHIIEQLESILNHVVS